MEMLSDDELFQTSILLCDLINEQEVEAGLRDWCIQSEVIVTDEITRRQALRTSLKVVPTKEEG